MNEFIGPYWRPWIYGPPPFSSSKARVSPHVFSRNMALPVASPQKEALKSGKWKLDLWNGPKKLGGTCEFSEAFFLLWETHPGSPTILTQFQQNLDCFFCVRLGLKSFLSIQLSIRYPSKNKEKLQMFKLITFLFKTGLLRKNIPKSPAFSLHSIPSHLVVPIGSMGLAYLPTWNP